MTDFKDLLRRYMRHIENLAEITYLHEPWHESGDTFSEEELSILRELEKEEENEVDTFERQLTQLINKFGIDNDHNTPDYILCDYITGCLAAFNRATKLRDTWLRCDDE